MQENPLKRSILYTKTFIDNNRKIIISIFVSVITFRISQYYYFGGNPFFNLYYLGETILGGLSFIIIYFLGFTFGDLIVKQVQEWFRLVIKSIVNELWIANTNRFGHLLNKTEPITETIDDQYKNGWLLDTSALIDGRIVGVIKTGFFADKIIITQGVVDELHHMSDKSDSLKRAKGRLGLDNMKKIKKYIRSKNFHLVNVKDSKMPVDKSLIEFCKNHKTKLVTVDFNLNKAAKVSNVKVLNINKLANEIKTNVVPGQLLLVKLMQKGKEKGQAVGYLDDGTMIIVQDADELIGKEIDATVDRVIQTEAGKLIFASYKSS